MSIKFWGIAFLALLATGMVMVDLQFHTGLTGGAIWITAHVVFGGVSFALAAVPHINVSGVSIGIAAGLSLALIAVCTTALNARYPSLKRFFFVIRLLGGLAILMLGSISLVRLATHTTKLIRNDTVGVPARSWAGVATGNARQLTTSLRIYAAEHNGNFPRQLGELVDKGILSPEQFNKLNFAAQADGLPIPWVYCNGLHESAPGSVPLLMQPIPGRGGKHIVAFKDSSVDFIPAGQYDEGINRWKENASNP